MKRQSWFSPPTTAAPCRHARVSEARSTDDGADRARRQPRRHAPRRGFGWCPCRGRWPPAATTGAAGVTLGVVHVRRVPPAEIGQEEETIGKVRGRAAGSVVAFVPPHKLVATLEDAAAVFGGGEEVRGVPRDDQGATAARVFFPALSLSLWIFSSPEARGRARSRPRARAFATERARAFASRHRALSVLAGDSLVTFARAMITTKTRQCFRVHTHSDRDCLGGRIRSGEDKTYTTKA